MIHIKEIHTAIRSGSSVPVVGSDENDIERFIKLIGSGDSVYAVITEFILNSIAEQLTLPVLPKQLVLIDEKTARTVLYEEIRDMIQKSYGINLAYTYHEQNKVVSIQEVLSDLSPIHKQRLFLLDVFFRNIDRTVSNHGFIHVNDTLYISDFGVSLIIRAVMNDKIHNDNIATNQLLKEHCTYTEDISDATIEEFFSDLQRIDFSAIVRNVPEQWIRICSSLHISEAKEVLVMVLMKLVTEKTSFKSFLSQLFVTKRIDEQEQKEKRAHNRKRFEEMMGLK